MKKLLLILIFIPIVLVGQEYNRNILVEVLTNSHCVLCPPAHSTIDAYLTQSSNSSRVRYIYYHMNFPYPDDPLNSANTSDAAARNLYYGPFSSTPQTFFDGTFTPGNYSQWSSVIDARLAIPSPLGIKLSGTRSSNAIKIDANITVSPAFTANDLIIQFVVVENIYYQGRNGIAYHKNVMRKIAGSAGGQSISSNSQKTSTTIPLVQNWQTNNLGVVAFVQRTSTKEVLQSEYISFADLLITDITDETLSLPEDFILYQNFPNPFNPATVIRYKLPISGNVSLKVYDLLGNEVASLVNEFQGTGPHQAIFNASGLTSGVYFYVLRSQGKKYYNKMLLLK